MAQGSWISSLTDFTIRRRWWVLASCVAATGALAFLAAGLTTNNNYDTWLPENDRVATLFKETDREFSSNALIFVVLAFPEQGVFHPASLAEVRRFTEFLESVPELFYVLSLTNIVDIKPIADGISVGNLIEDIPADPGALEALREYVFSREMYRNTVVSADARYTAILMNIDGSYDEVEVASRILDLLKEKASGTAYYFGGDPALAHYMDLYMNQDLQRLLPLTFLIMVAILWIGLRRFWGVVLPLTMVLLCLIWTLGFQRIVDMPLNLLTPAVMILLIALGSDYSVHVINHYLRVGDLGRASRQIALPVLMSGLTTIAGLLTFGTTHIRILSDFGYELAFGIGAACFLSVFLLAALLGIVRMRPETGGAGKAGAPPACDAEAAPGAEPLREPAEAPPTGAPAREPMEAPPTGAPAREPMEAPLFGRLVEAVTLRVLAHRRLFLAGVALLVLGMGFGITRIHTNVDLITFVPEDSPPRAGHGILQEHFGGIYPVSLYCRGEIEEPSLLMMQLRMENLLRRNPKLSGFSSVASLIAEMNRLLTGVYAIPEDRAGVANLWLLMEGESYLKPLVNEARDKALLSAMIGESSTEAMKETARYVEGTIRLGEPEEALTVDWARLSSPARSQLLGIQAEQAAAQLASLSAGYAGEHAWQAGEFRRRLAALGPPVRQPVRSEAVEQVLRDYLREEAGPELSPSVAEEFLRVLQARFPAEAAGEVLGAEPQRLLQDQGGLDPDSAEILTEGAVYRFREESRKEQVRRYEEALFVGLPDLLAGNQDFLRRARGVLWEYTSPRPVFLRNDCSQVAGLDQAVVKRVPFEVDQTGAPSIFRRFDQLLYRSQIQSLLLASLVVFLMVSVTQRSLRRGFISIVAVLVPLEMVIGFMGWAGIPLDFGSALFGALVIGVGIDGCIHVLHYESRIRERGLSEDESLAATLRHVGRAVLTANLTTAAGFGTLIFSMTSAIRNFAVLNVIAIALVTASVLTLLPVLIKLSHVFVLPPLRGRGNTSGPA